ncbi:S-adenosyl-L-methionine-dependent methyltransferase [Lentithecium fluviatile CBS 122367]|uniref:S-adenosyl-L-methionine-dependent methyltransferase n=1 Tax=Lentithecium fluviatile CBS 122367 TaxID=1168545 RepID=A0A6G1J1H4_9PLEO|nr:S-adenosyl-L-methionine-dependent methyltransferase [Lentithecium fluviatile CBS 122367]
MAEVNPSQQPTVPAAQAIHHELRNAENSAAFVLPTLQSMKMSNPYLALLDVGAGSGTISASFAKALPDGHITAVDLNPNILPRARAVAEAAGVTNIDFQQADVKKLPFADASFDITFCHQTLTHMSAPEDALREMLRVTKPGGIVAAREGDFETEAVWPDLPGLVKFHRFAAELMRSAGGTPTAGRQLLSWALEAGAERSKVAVSFGTWSYHTQSDKDTWARGLIAVVKGGPMREKGLNAGLTTEGDLDEMIHDWEKWAASSDSSVAMLHGEILIQR